MTTNDTLIQQLTDLAFLLAHGTFDDALPDAWQRDTIASLLETVIVRLAGNTDYDASNAQAIVGYMERGEWSVLVARAGELV